MKHAVLVHLLLITLLNTHAQSKRSTAPGEEAGKDYFPPAGEWQHRSPASLGLPIGAPLSAFIHIGNGTNFIYVDPEHRLAVVRWIDNASMDGMVKKILEAL